MASTFSLPFCLEPQQQHHLSLKKQLLRSSQSQSLTPIFTSSSYHFLFLHQFQHFTLKSSLHSSSSSSSEAYLRDSLKTGRFLGTEEVEKLRKLQNFQYFHEFEYGSMRVGVMGAEDLDSTVGLLSESFAESMSLPFGYVPLLGLLVKQYMVERRALMPHMATLVAFYKEDGGEQEELAGTVEVSFNRKGANTSPPTPVAPKESPYICNMAVKKPLRRRGIGWHLLKACEELICQMTSSLSEVYLHCRIIDTAPFSMYAKAGYSVVKTDNFLILLTLQRRKHLMRKRLTIFNDPSESVTSSSDDHSLS